MTEGNVRRMENFAEDVLHGLTSNPKRLMSQYFYDETGSKIFQEIMAMPEYYLTNCERNIFLAHAEDIARDIQGDKLEIIELGAGDGSKTYYLLKALMESEGDFVYRPVDISAEALRQIEDNFSKRLKGLKMESMQNDYFSALELLAEEEHVGKKLVLFLGSNIGNFNYQGGLSFLKRLNSLLNKGDQVFIGIDLKKSPAIILPAYSDAQNITARFNFNLLERMNRELGAHFNLKNFKHYASYEPESGEVLSYLISLKDQEVLIEKLNRSFHFKEMENIQTEISKKYSEEEFKKMSETAGFTWKEAYFDGNRYFMDVLLEKSE